jgi:NAD-dependent deacetylase
MAGSKIVFELHGSVLKNYCLSCGKRFDFEDAKEVSSFLENPVCDKCGGFVRPDVVFYEEPLDEKILTGAISAIKEADTLIVGGTSLVVYPAAGLIRYFGGDNLVLINLSPTSFDSNADLVIRKPIGEALGG